MSIALLHGHKSKFEGKWKDILRQSRNQRKKLIDEGKERIRKNQLIADIDKLFRNVAEQQGVTGKLYPHYYSFTKEQSIIVYYVENPDKVREVVVKRDNSGKIIVERLASANTEKQGLRELKEKLLHESNKSLTEYFLESDLNSELKTCGFNVVNVFFWSSDDDPTGAYEEFYTECKKEDGSRYKIDGILTEDGQLFVCLAD